MMSTGRWTLSAYSAGGFFSTVSVLCHSIYGRIVCKSRFPEEALNETSLMQSQASCAGSFSLTTVVP
jgi:hypothetical protein